MRKNYKKIKTNKTKVATSILAIMLSGLVVAAEQPSETETNIPFSVGVINSTDATYKKLDVYSSDKRVNHSISSGLSIGAMKNNFFTGNFIHLNYGGNNYSSHEVFHLKDSILIGSSGRGERFNLADKFSHKEDNINYVNSVSDTVAIGEGILSKNLGDNRNDFNVRNPNLYSFVKFNHRENDFDLKSNSVLVGDYTSSLAGAATAIGNEAVAGRTMTDLLDFIRYDKETNTYSNLGVSDIQKGETAEESFNRRKVTSLEDYYKKVDGALAALGSDLKAPEIRSDVVFHSGAAPDRGSAEFNYLGVNPSDTVSGDGSVALGANSLAFRGKTTNTTTQRGNGGYNPFTDSYGDEGGLIDKTKASSGEVSIGKAIGIKSAAMKDDGELLKDFNSSTDDWETYALNNYKKEDVQKYIIKRQLTNVAAGTYDSDAVNIAQLKTLRKYVDSKAAQPIVFGVDLVTTGANSFATGNGSKALGDNSVAMGVSSTASGERSFAMGNGNKAIGINSVAMGENSQALEKGSFALGKDNKAYGNSSIAMGEKAIAKSHMGTAIGYGAEVDFNSFGAVAIGQGAKVVDKNLNSPGLASTAIGYFANVSSPFSTAIGTNSKAEGGLSFAGAGGKSVGIGSVAIGGSGSLEGNGELKSPAIAYSTNSIALGKGTVAGREEKNEENNNLQAVAIGYDAQATNDKSLAVGFKTKANGKNTVSIGSGNTVNGNNTVVLGSGITTANADNNVILGNMSSENSSTTTNGVANENTVEGYAGVSVGIVSVGASGKERKIINVAPAVISATSTDAVNGSQLFKITESIANLESRIGSDTPVYENGVIDLSSIKNKIAANTSKITANTSKISENTGKIANNTATITENTGKINGNTTNIANNTAKIAENSSKLNEYVGKADANTVSIGNNTNLIGENTGKINTNTNNIASNTNKITENTTKINDNLAKITGNTAKIDDNASKINENSTKIAENNTKILDNTTKIGKNTTDIASLKASLTDSSTAVNDLTGRVTKNETDLTGLKADVATNTSDIAKLKTNLTESSTAVNDLTGRVAKNESDITDIKSDIVTVKADVITNKGNITTNTNDITKLKTDLTNSNTAVDNLTGRVTKNEEGIATVKGNITDLGTKLDAQNTNINLNATAIDAVKTLAETTKETVAENSERIKITSEFTADLAMAVNTVDDKAEKNKTDVHNLTLEVDSNARKAKEDVKQLADAVVLYNTSGKDTITLAGRNGTALNNIKASEITKNSNAAVVGSQLYTTNEKVKENTNSINEVKKEVGNSVKYSDDGSVTLANNSKDNTKGTVIKNVEGGTVTQGSKEAINGGQIYELTVNINKALTKNYVSNTKLYNFANSVNSRMKSLENRLNTLRQGAYDGVASAIAMANMPTPTYAGQSLFNAGIGSYKGYRALSLGIAHLTEDKKISFKASVSLTENSNQAFGAGVGFAW